MNLLSEVELEVKKIEQTFQYRNKMTSHQLFKQLTGVGSEENKQLDIPTVVNTSRSSICGLVNYPIAHRRILSLEKRFFIHGSLENTLEIMRDWPEADSC